MTPRLHAGTSVGPYRIDALIGTGGMGEVYRAHDSRLQRDVAIKVLTGDASSDPDARRRLLREARAAAALNHPHVCTIHDVGEADGQAYIAMELIEGRPLDQVIPAGGLPVDQVVSFGLQIADAVAHAHERGIVHRDLKTANTLVAAQGRAKVLDFGLATRMSAAAVPDATTELAASQADAGKIAGTLAYMAPEQLRGQPAETRSDVWALGVVLYELATGTRPFRGGTGFELSSAILSEPPEPLPANIPVTLRTVIERCLQKHAVDRYASAHHVYAALETIVQAAADTADAGAAPPGRQAPSGVAGSRAAAVAAAVIVAVVGLIGAVWLGIGGRTPRATADPRERTRLAVLPFDNVSQADEEFFVEGITRDINTQLSRIAHFFVIAHGSAERADGGGASYAEIARRLNVQYLVDGSVSRVGDRVRISVSLIDPATDGQVWADDYDREITVSSILGARRDVALKVANALNVTMTPEESASLAEQTTASLEAYRAYQLGRFFWAKRNVPALEAAIGHFERAIALDPDFALAHAGLADAFVLLPFFGGRAPAVGQARAEAAATRALELDARLGQAHTTLGLVREFEFNWQAADQHFRRAVELSPEYATAHHWYADMLARQRRPDEALGEIRRALELDPLSSIINQDHGYVLLLAGERDEGIEQFERTVELDPGFISTWGVLAFALLDAGRFEQAESALTRQAELSGRDPAPLRQFVAAVAAYRRTGLAEPVPDAIDPKHLFGPVYVAPAYALLGQKGAALAVLERGFEQRAFSTVSSMLHSSFREYRSEPRFVALLQKAGLP